MVFDEVRFVSVSPTCLGRAGPWNASVLPAEHLVLSSRPHLILSHPCLTPVRPLTNTNPCPIPCPTPLRPPSCPITPGQEMARLEPLVRRVAAAGVDALIMQDMGAVELVIVPPRSSTHT